MNDYRASDDRVFAGERKVAIEVVEFGAAITVGGDVAQIAEVAGFGVARGVRLIGGIEVSAGGTGVGGGAIAVFVNVDAVFARRETGELGDHADRIAFGVKADGSPGLLILRGVEAGDGVEFEGARGMRRFGGGDLRIGVAGTFTARGEREDEGRGKKDEAMTEREGFHDRGGLDGFERVG